MLVVSHARRIFTHRLRIHRLHRIRKFHPRRPRHRTRPQCMHPVRIILVAADAAFDLVSSLYPHCLWSFRRHRHPRSWPCPRSPPRRV